MLTIFILFYLLSLANMGFMKKNANKQAKKHLALFARLANIEQLGTLKDWEKLQLVDETREAGFSWVAMTPSLRSVRGHKAPVWDLHVDGRWEYVHSPFNDPVTSWGMQSAVPFEWQALLDAHEHCVPLLRNAVDGKAVLLDPMECQVDAKTGRLQHRPMGGDAPPRALQNAFLLIFRSETFPFRRCPVEQCRKIFIAAKNQKFCSPACRDQGTTTRRKDARREYMRVYMEERRRETRSGKKKPTQ